MRFKTLVTCLLIICLFMLSSCRIFRLKSDLCRCGVIDYISLPDSSDFTASQEVLYRVYHSAGYDLLATKATLAEHIRTLEIHKEKAAVLLGKFLEPLAAKARSEGTRIVRDSNLIAKFPFYIVNILESGDAFIMRRGTGVFADEVMTCDCGYYLGPLSASVNYTVYVDGKVFMHEELNASAYAP